MVLRSTSWGCSAGLVTILGRILERDYVARAIITIFIFGTSDYRRRYGIGGACEVTDVFTLHCIYTAMYLHCSAFTLHFRGE